MGLEKGLHPAVWPPFSPRREQTLETREGFILSSSGSFIWLARRGLYTLCLPYAALFLVFI